MPRSLGVGVNVKAVAMLLQGREWKSGARAVQDNALYLYDTKVAWVEGDKVYVTFADYPTPTTFRLLNEVLAAVGCPQRFHQYKHEPCLDGQPLAAWDIVEVQLSGKTPLSTLAVARQQAPPQ